MNEIYMPAMLAILVLIIPIVCALLVLGSVRNKDEVLKVMYEQEWLLRFKEAPKGKWAWLEMAVSMAIAILGLGVAIIFRTHLMSIFIGIVFSYSFIRLMRYPLLRLKVVIIALLPMAVAAITQLLTEGKEIPGIIIFFIVTSFFVGMLYQSQRYLFVLAHLKKNQRG